MEPFNLNVIDLVTEAHMNDASAIIFHKPKNVLCTARESEGTDKINNEIVFSVDSDNDYTHKTSESAEKLDSKIILSIFNDNNGTYEASEDAEKLDNEIVLSLSSEYECLDAASAYKTDSESHYKVSSSDDTNKAKLQNGNVQKENNQKENNIRKTMFISLSDNRENCNQELGNDQEGDTLASGTDIHVTSNEDMNLFASNEMAKELETKKSSKILELSKFMTEKSNILLKRSASFYCEIIDNEDETKEIETFDDISADIITEIDKDIDKSLMSALCGNVGHKKMETCNNLTSSVTGSVNGIAKISELCQSKHNDTHRKGVDLYRELLRAEKPFITNKTSKPPQTFFGEPNKASDKPDTYITSSKPADSIGNINKFETLDKKENIEDDVVWICFVCAKEFSSQSKLMTHQNACEENMGDQKTDVISQTPSETLQNLQNNNSITSSHTYTDDINYSLFMHVPAMFRKVRSDLNTLPLGLSYMPTIFQYRQKKFDDIYIPPSRDVYFEALGLFPTPTVEHLSKSPHKNISEDNCQIIDLIDDIQDGMTNVLLTPRSKSILFQISRDRSNCSEHKHRLTYAQSGDSSAPDADSDESKSSENSEDNCRRENVPSKSAILGIPLTSPLGQRLKQHWHYDVKVPIIDDIEDFCKNNDTCIEDETRKVNNKMTEKLRNRPPPQVTFKFTKHYLNRWCHSYKFNCADKREFQKRLATGLDHDSRIKLKRMKPYKVILYRLSKKDIQYWTTARTKSMFTSVPNPNMKQKYINNAQTGPSQYPWYTEGVHSQVSFPHLLPRNTLFQQVTPVQHPNYVFNYARPIGLRGNFALRPKPQLLVQRVSNGVKGMNLEVLSMQQASQMNNLHMPSNSTVPSAKSRNQKRKQTFDNVRQDDMVICLSSDDEEEPVLLVPSCAMCRVYKNKCSIHGTKRRIGPAYFMKSLELSNKQQTSNTPAVKNHVHRNIPKHHITSNLHQVQYTNTSTASSILFSVNKPLVNFGGSIQFQNMSHLKIVQGKPILLNDRHNMPQNSPSMPMLSIRQTSAPDAEIPSVDQREPSAALIQSDGDMDFEVICIDSDDDI